MSDRKPHIVGLTVNGDEEASQSIQLTEHVCRQGGIDFIVRRIPKIHRFQAGPYIEEVEADTTVHGIIFFTNISRTILDYKPADDLDPESASDPLHHLYDYLHYVYQNTRFAYDVVKAASQQQPSNSQRKPLAFVGLAGNIQRFKSLHEPWPNRLRDCRICLLNPSDLARRLFATRLVEDAAKIFCVNDDYVIMFHKGTENYRYVLDVVPLREQKVQDILCSCHIIIGDRLYTDSEASLFQQSNAEPIWIVLSSWDLLNGEVEQKGNFEISTAEALDVSILLKNLKRVRGIHPAFPTLGPSSSQILTQKIGKHEDPIEDSLEDLLKTPTQPPAPLEPKTPKKRSRRNATTVPKSTKNRQSSDKATRARQRKQQRSMTAAFDKLNISDAQPASALRERTSTEINKQILKRKKARRVRPSGDRKKTSKGRGERATSMDEAENAETHLSNSHPSSDVDMMDG